MKVLCPKYFNANPTAPHGFPLSELQIENILPLNDFSRSSLTRMEEASYGYKTGIPVFPLGGVTRFVAYGTNELLTNQYFLGQLGYIRELKKLPPLLGSSINFLGMLEIGKTYQLPIGPKPPYLHQLTSSSELLVDRQLRIFHKRSSRWETGAELS